MILGTHHIALHTADLARLRDFYVNVLGLAGNEVELVEQLAPLDSPHGA